jgi:predicted PurR-regulated permease PerM
LPDSGNSILSSMDLFIEKIQQLKGIMLGVSFSAVILAPLAMGISLYLFTHPNFLRLIEHEWEFAILLTVLLTVVLVTSGIWLVAGIQQFRSLSSWNKRYCNYLQKREDLDKDITSKYHLDDEK